MATKVFVIMFEDTAAKSDGEARLNSATTPEAAEPGETVELGEAAVTTDPAHRRRAQGAPCTVGAQKRPA